MSSLVCGKYPRVQMGSPTTLSILRVLGDRGPMTDHELSEATGIERRQIQHGREFVVDNGLVAWTGEMRRKNPHSGRAARVWQLA